MVGWVDGSTNGWTDEQRVIDGQDKDAKLLETRSGNVVSRGVVAHDQL